MDLQSLRAKPCGGRRQREENADEAGSQKARQSMGEREAKGVSRCQTRQGFVNHVKNFAFCSESQGKSLRGAKEGSDVFRFTFRVNYVGMRVEVGGQLGGRERYLGPGNGRYWKKDAGSRETQERKSTELGASYGT